MAITIPARLATACTKSVELSAWLAQLPGTVRDLQRRWSLTIETPFDGDEVSCSWVAPVMLPDRASAVLKISMPHMEGQHEIQGLRFWNGDPTVRLLASEDDHGAMLLERCAPGTALRSLPEADQDIVIARLLRRIWRVPSAPHPFRPLSRMIAFWSDETLAPNTGPTRASFVRVFISWKSCRKPRRRTRCSRQTCTPETYFVPIESRGSSLIQSHSSATPRTMRPNIC